MVRHPIQSGEAIVEKQRGQGPTRTSCHIQLARSRLEADATFNLTCNILHAYTKIQAQKTVTQEEMKDGVPSNPIFIEKVEESRIASISESHPRALLKLISKFDIIINHEHPPPIILLF